MNGGGSPQALEILRKMNSLTQNQKSGIATLLPISIRDIWQFTNPADTHSKTLIWWALLVRAHRQG